MAPDDLNQPLGRSAAAPPERRSLVAAALVAAAAAVALLAAVWIAVVDDPDGGRPVAVAVIKGVEPAATGSLGEVASAEDALAGGSAPSPPAAVEIAALPGSPAPPAVGAESGLIEHGAFGPLPRVAADGRRPRDVYARRASPAIDGAARVVIVVGGLGLSQTGTQRAIETLPEDVTLAFAPYGSSLQRWVDKARAEGHEILLQIPLEPVGYPDENPGEHTLTISSGPRGIGRDLSWVLARMTSYAGVMNYMGGRFSSDSKAMAPLLGEIGERGLFYLDDNSSPQSVAAPVGEALEVPVVTADLVLDQVRSEEAIERALATLETIARTRGVAVGVASAFPGSVEAIARWVAEASGRGIAVVPASAALKS